MQSVAERSRIISPFRLQGMSDGKDWFATRDTDDCIIDLVIEHEIYIVPTNDRGYKEE